MTHRYASAVLLSAALTTAALALTTGERTPVATITGAARSCVRLSSIKVSRIRDDRTIDFMTGNRTGYRNVLPAACRGLGREQRFGYATSRGELCSTDVITVLTDSGIPRGASCGLGRFQPITLAKGGR